MIIRVGHVRAAGLCTTGLRVWCRRNGVSLRELCRDGVDTTQHPELLSDPFVVRVIDQAREETPDVAPR